jgi:hypothetical protein
MSNTQDKNGQLKPGPFAATNAGKKVVDHVDVNNKRLETRKPIRTTTQQLKSLR